MKKWNHPKEWPTEKKMLKNLEISKILAGFM